MSAEAPAPAEAVSEFCEPQDAPRPRQAALARAFAMWRRCSTLPQRLALRYMISSSESYLKLCEAEGITKGRSITTWQDQLQEMREQLRALERQA